MKCSMFGTVHRELDDLLIQIEVDMQQESYWEPNKTHFVQAHAGYLHEEGMHCL